jgi:hypothetical protein
MGVISNWNEPRPIGVRWTWIRCHQIRKIYFINGLLNSPTSCSSLRHWQNALAVFCQALSVVATVRFTRRGSCLICLLKCGSRSSPKLPRVHYTDARGKSHELHPLHATSSFWYALHFYIFPTSLAILFTRMLVMIEISVFGCLVL